MCTTHAGIARCLRVTVYWRNAAYRYDLEQVRLTCRLKCPHAVVTFFLLCSDYNMMSTSIIVVCCLSELCGLKKGPKKRKYASCRLAI